MKKSALYCAGLATATGFLSQASWAISGNDTTLRLVFFTDLHSSPKEPVVQALESAAQIINLEETDLLIGGGDFITDGLELNQSQTHQHWESYFQFQRALSGDVFPAIGNHDFFIGKENRGEKKVNPRGEFLRRFGLTNPFYSFEAAGYHFVVLDSVSLCQSDLRYRGLISPEQLEWLKQDLSGLSPKTPIIMVSHLPLATNSLTAYQNHLPLEKLVVQNAGAVLDLFKNKNLILVLQGHLHINEMIKSNKTTFITGGAVCGNWWNGSWHDTPRGYGVITLRANRLNWEYKELHLAVGTE